ncbi:MAG: T9SS type A sorting domain-containing protein [Bacteroidetes bacterium]|nr:T9SS type A sorting domain-containing protein [Bacteroidota bacterium]
MKKQTFSALFLLLASFCLSNVPPSTEAVITEIYFANNGEWTIEILFNSINSHSMFTLYTLQDSANFSRKPNEPGIMLLTQNDLDKYLWLNRSGGELYIFDYYLGDIMAKHFRYGNVPGSMVNPPFLGQTIHNPNRNYNYENFEILGSQPGLGELQEPQRGLLHGFVFDSTGNPVKFFHVKHSNCFGINETWTDSTGYFFNPTLMPRNYEVTLDNEEGTIWVDTMITLELDSSIYTNFRIPAKSEVVLSGHCKLYQGNNHARIKVILTPECNDFSPIYAFTDSSGYFETTVPIGRYYLRCSMFGFYPYFTPGLINCFQDNYLIDHMLYPGTVNEISMGEQSGIWENDYHYWLFGDIQVPEGETLQILPGVEIFFKRYGNFDVFGTLDAKGTKDDPIVFSYTPWEGLRFTGNSSSNSILEYFEISDNDSGIIIQDASPILSHGIIHDVPPVRRIMVDIRGNASPVFKYIDFQNEGLYYYPALYFCRDSSSPVISYGIFCHPDLKISPGIVNTDHSTPRLSNNIFNNNFAAVANLDHASPDLINNIFINNEFIFYPYHTFQDTAFRPYHNLFYNIVIYFKDPIPGFGNLCQTNINGDSCDVYFNLFMDPMFADTTYLAYNLLENSPCIDAGDPTFPYDPDNTISDIGACFYDQIGVRISQRPPINPGFSMFIIPNPTNGNANIILHKEEHLSWNNARIRLFDLSGRAVAQEEIGYLLPRDNEYRMGLQDLTNSSALKGTYLLSLEINNTVMVSKKLIVE